MKISKLTLHGFKSFADKTEFDFRDGITVIVGPNGCGKSNVVDAVKWVLGEQRPSSLRGKEMQDVIFSGTDSRKRVGYAEVSMVLDNAEHTLPLDYEEVEITRRLYRSGESEYLINGNSVRLRDIRELMMDSGGGPGAMTVMEQGNIDRLLQADPQERRVVFEEAAGIAKYRARRKETQRKLERTDDNLNRLRDILGEYETRQRSLKIQAGKARRFLEMTEELKQKRLAGALARYAELARRREESLAELEDVERLETEARSRLERAVDGGAGQRKALDALREQVSAGEQEMASQIGEARAQQEKRAAREREIGDLLERAEKARQESATAGERADVLDAELGQAKAIAARAGEQQGVRDATLAAADALLKEVEGRVKRMSHERSALDMKRSDAFAQETEARNREMECDAEIKALSNRLERLRTRKRGTEHDLLSLEAAKDQSHAEVARLEEELRRLEDRAHAAEIAHKEARQDVESRGGELARIEGDIKAFRARREVLAGFLAGGEGLSAGTKALLEAAAEGRLKGISGTLADHIGNAGDQAAPLDLALGDLAGALVVDTTEQALKAIEWLKQGRRGRARLIPIDRVGEPLVDALLKGTTIVDTVDEALRADGRVVVLTGEEFEASGTVVGGTGDAGAGLVRRNAELAEIETALEAAEEACEQAQSSHDGARHDAAEWEETIEELRPRLNEVRDGVRNAGQRFAAAEKAVSARAEEIELETAESNDVERMIVECRQAARAARDGRLKTEKSRGGLEQASEELRERLKRTSAEREQAAGRRTEATVEAARWAEKVEAAESRMKAFDDAMTAARREAEARARESEHCIERRGACEDEIAVIDKLALARDAALDKLARRVEQRRREAQEMAAQLDAGDRAVRELRDVHEHRREELERYRMKEHELRLRVETLLDQVRRDHGLDLARIEMADGEEHADSDTLERELEELRHKLERLGNVNHAALEQLAEIEDKLDFMRREEADLVAAEKQLRETITKIDEVSTTRFTETFQNVCENFRVIFRKLFGGGKADIYLEDPEDVLNSGIEIKVRPPGKELRNMALLSGGERSLTTVALLFAIYQTKPPPFCLLDEVDAALDEPNTVRMCEMLKEFAKRGQFLIITHARPTMTVADTLYGVTMPEAGVSRRVAVRFADIEAGRVVGLN